MTKGPEKVVLKMQRPVFTTDNYNQVLYYNESRSILGIYNLNPETINDLFGEAHKIFVLGTLDKKNHLTIDKILDENAYDW